MLAGAENILRAYSKAPNSADMVLEAEYDCLLLCFFMMSCRVMIQDAKNKITFIKMELLRQRMQEKSTTHQPAGAPEVSLQYRSRYL